MTTYMLGLPAEVRHRLRSALPRNEGHSPVVKVTCRDHDERQCPAYDADHYEVQAYYTVVNAGSLTALEEALKATPGVYATTRVCPADDRVTSPNAFSNPEWPAALGTARRDRDTLRPQVIALMKDEKRQ
jgi:hypothetical protein